MKYGYAKWISTSLLLVLFGIALYLYTNKLGAKEESKVENSPVINTGNLINTDDLEVALLVCDTCKGKEIFIVLNVGQINVVDHYETSYFCSACDTVRSVHVEWKWKAD